MAVVSALFVALTALMTWPQPRVFATHAVEHQDVFFNMWRLRWIAHALITAPLELFNANVFHPEHGVLAYSDAMLLEGILAAPLTWAGLPPVLVHNVMLIAPIVASAIGAVVLARHVTGSLAASLIAGIVFAYAPYRFDHFMHMELQWTVWMPWAFWALQRSIETGAVRFGLLAGLFVSLQMASSVYYGVFLGIVSAVVGGVQLAPLRGKRLLHAGRSLVIAGLLAGGFSAVYARPYASASERVGTREEAEATTFSARPRDYRMATPDNLLHGARSAAGMPERRLFPGLVPLILGLIGLLLIPLRPATVAYVVGLVVAFELSLGFFGRLYPWLYDSIPVFRGLRAPARASVFCLLFLGVFGAQGLAALGARLAPRLRQAVTASACLVVLCEYWVAPLTLIAYPNDPPPLYALMARLPPGVVAHFPMPRPESPPHHDPRYAYLSTFHWHPLVNGYSGFFPASYRDRLERLRTFPDAASVAHLRQEGIRYIIVHSDGYPGAGDRHRIVDRLTHLGLTRVADFTDGWGMATLLRFW